MSIELSPDHKKVLAVLADSYDGLYYNFAHIESETGLPRKRVRFICRFLARRGLAQYRNGLMDDDGGVAGAGYRATKAGAEYTS